MGTFEKVGTGFVNVGYLFPQRCVPHGVLMGRCGAVVDRLGGLGHVGYVEITVSVTVDDRIRLEEI